MDAGLDKISKLGVRRCDRRKLFSTLLKVANNGNELHSACAVS